MNKTTLKALRKKHKHRLKTAIRLDRKGTTNKRCGICKHWEFMFYRADQSIGVCLNEESNEHRNYEGYFGKCNMFVGKKFDK